MKCKNCGKKSPLKFLFFDANGIALGGSFKIFGTEVNPTEGHDRNSCNNCCKCEKCENSRNEVEVEFEAILTIRFSSETFDRRKDINEQAIAYIQQFGEENYLDIDNIEIDNITIVEDEIMELTQIGETK